ncbi:amino acid ABC transporter permease [Priestia aryabhattai]|uniref:amino acid ABC transporter permease n=1 Tax=Priestia aryabhattai TaxID=412384 RepID=UPI00203E942F|nr:amino acid ABC transporter permease [Priestia aryabhattai]MCM3772224.1 amino acid ABC transporter permease [Priestia aryabhattai]
MISTDFHDWLKLLWQVVDKLPLTLFMLGLSLLFSLLLGFVIALIRIQKKPVLSKMATIYLSFMRCTPLLVQLFLVYFGLPQLLLLVHIDINSWSRITFLVIAFSLHTAAPLSEVIRSAYFSIDKGQFEAAYSIGMNYFQTLRRIILPQAFVAALPNLGNATISLLKDTALAFTIGIIDIMGQVRLILGNNYGIGMFEIYVTISLVYWSMCIVIEITVSYLEKHFKKGSASISK